MRLLVQADVDSERAGRCLPARVSASWLTPRLDFAEHRATGFSMGQPPGQEFSDGRSRPPPGRCVTAFVIRNEGSAVAYAGTLLQMTPNK